jgi:hypothetical protein
MRIAGSTVSSPREAADAIHAAQNANKSAVPLLVMRDGAQTFLGLQLAKARTKRAGNFPAFLLFGSFP